MERGQLTERGRPARHGKCGQDALAPSSQLAKLFCHAPYAWDSFALKSHEAIQNSRSDSWIPLCTSYQKL